MSKKDDFGPVPRNLAQRLISYLPWISIAKGQGIIGKHPYICVYWCGPQWVVRLGKTGVYGIASKFSFKWNLNSVGHG